MDKERLIRAGIDYEDGVHRFAGRPEVYEKYLMKFFDQNEMSALRQALEQGDYDAAFRAAHNMKSNAGSLSLTAFYRAVCKLVDALRAGVRGESLLELFGQAQTLYDAVRLTVKEDTHG